jgi:hypothetical protein
MTPDEIYKLSRDELLDVMRREGISPMISLFATIHHKSPDRPNGYSEEDLEEIGEQLEDGDTLRWRRELAEHFAKKG